jgi:nitroreductase
MAVPIDGYVRYSEDEMLHRAQFFSEMMSRRCSIRSFSEEPVPREVVAECIRAAGLAPSGANRQPWHFVVIGDPATKSRIRAAAEKAERAFYEDPRQHEWHKALTPLGISANKPFLTAAPCLIAVFTKPHDITDKGIRLKNFYVRESVGIATGMLITALHMSGLGTLTYTPSRMDFLTTILNRPANERPFMVVVAGYPAVDSTTPNASRVKKGLDDILDYC